MKLAYVYFYEFVNSDEIYRLFLKKSICSLLDNNICKGEDIFINVLGTGEAIHKEILEFAKTFNIRIFDVSENMIHYHDYFKIQIDDNNKESNPWIRFFNHKFTNYKEIIELGYDGIVQIDTDVIFYDNINYLFKIKDKESLYMMHLTSECGDISRDRINSILYEREHNTNIMFSFCEYSKLRFNYTTQLCKLLLNYDLNNFVDDIYNIGFWPSGGIYLFTREVIEQHGDMLRFLNYFVTKDDEIAVLLYTLAKKVKLKTLDKNEITAFSLPVLKSDPSKYKIFHPGGYELKRSLVREGLDKF
jgi:hypothetical protein